MSAIRAGYKQTEVGVIPEDWIAIDLPDFCLLQRGFDITEKTKANGVIPVYSSSGLSYFHNKAMAFPPGVVTGRKGILGKVFLINEPFWPHDTTLWVKDFKGNLPAFVALVLQNFHLERLDAATSVPTLNRNNLAGHMVAIPPTKAEQEAISEALSDADTFIESLEQLLEKKRHLKQGAMQELLTGNKRLPGFSGEWDVNTLASLAHVNKGTQLLDSEASAQGQFPHFNGGVSPSGYTGKTNTAADTIAISEGGNSCGFVQLVREAFWCGGHCYAVVPKSIDNRFLYHALKGQQTAIMGLRVGSGLPNVQKTALKAFHVLHPSDPAEQVAIADLLSEMDADMLALESKLAKTCAVKQGMMQKLLTGEIRLI